MNGRHVELSDCWSSEQQPAPYYRLAAARARRLQADATTPKVKQYLDKMIAIVTGWRAMSSPVCHAVPTGKLAGRQSREIMIDFNRDLVAPPDEKRGRCRSRVEAG